MSDAVVEGGPGHEAAILESIQAAEVVPPAQGNARQLQAAPAHAGILHGVIAGIGRTVGHDYLLKLLIVDC
jgi:hypothetical protein